METEATRRAREYFEGAAPSSPQVAILRDGRLEHLMGRPTFLDRSPEAIAEEVAAAAASAGVPVSA
jgi:putative YphP/YqiW family bacilliredoxin